MEELRGLFHTMTKRFGFLNKNCCSVGTCQLSIVQSHILFEIDRHRKPSMQQIADSLGMDITTFSRQIQSLTRLKLVKKTPSESDKRVYLLSLTAEGTFVAESINCEMNSYLEEVFGRMNPFERETVIRSIKLLNDSMEQTGMCCSPLR